MHTEDDMSTSRQIVRFYAEILWKVDVKFFRQNSGKKVFLKHLNGSSILANS